MSPNENQIEERVVTHYLDSGDYNGLPLSRLAEAEGVDPSRLLELITKLIKAGRLSIPSPHQTNPFAKAFDVSVEEQLLDLENRDPHFVCLYPTPDSVDDNVDLSSYEDVPFTRLMMLAKPKLAAIPFRLDVLDFYEADPRYRFRFYDFGGTLGVRDEYRSQLDEADWMSFRFGIGYDGEGQRVVAVYLYQLAELPGKQQRIWQEFIVDGACKISEEYFRTTILAKPAEAISVYDAVIGEQVEINKIFKLMGRPPLFRETYEDQRRPRQFGFFMKPTLSNYNNFVQLLDKMLSENLNIASFRGDIDQRERMRVSDNEVELRSKGTITMLDEWLALRFPRLSAEERSDITGPLREVRQLRQKPSHKLVEDEYDRRFYDLQDELVWKVHEALKKFRDNLATDPAASSYQPPQWEGRCTLKSY